MVRAAASGAWGVVFALLVALPALAAGPPQSLRDALFPPDRAPPDGMPTTPPVARYRLDVGSSFVLDRLDPDDALLKFDGGDEVLALKGVTAAHGDIVFKNDLGEPVLRATRWGGVTLFTPSQPMGMPASLEGGGGTLHAFTPIGPQGLAQALAQSSSRAGRAVGGRLVVFDAPHVPAAFEWLFADAAELAADAFVRLAQDGGRALAARFSEVHLAPGRSPTVTTAGAVLMITISPDRGFAGRPSSRRIMVAVARR